MIQNKKYILDLLIGNANLHLGL